ncbi:hypothetical protein BDZ45DRAFT_803198 [Acephala macrosclerotiorum]|nr:hypothetical protein BDZ45DRAFT_803198 [Acephala macrosclerotiorum]
MLTKQPRLRQPQKSTSDFECSDVPAGQVSEGIEAIRKWSRRVKSRTKTHHEEAQRSPVQYSSSDPSIETRNVLDSLSFPSQQGRRRRRRRPSPSCRPVLSTSVEFGGSCTSIAREEKEESWDKEVGILLTGHWLRYTTRQPYQDGGGTRSGPETEGGPNRRWHLASQACSNVQVLGGLSAEPIILPVAFDDLI